MVEGMVDALNRLPEGGRVKKLILVEYNDDAYRAITSSYYTLRKGMRRFSLTWPWRS